MVVNLKGGRNVKSVIAGLAISGLMFAGNALAVDMPAKAKQFHCDICHAIDHKVVGPAWQDVAKRYKGQTTYKYSTLGSNAPDAKEYPLVDGLVKKVSRGGAGNWGEQRMIANNPTGSKDDDVRSLVQFILGLAD